MSMKTQRKTKVTSTYKVSVAKKTRSSAPKTISKSNGHHTPVAYEHLHIGIVHASPTGKYIDANDEFCRILGYSKKELLRLGIKDCTYEDDYGLDLKLHKQLVAGEIPFYGLEKRYVHKNGEIIWVELTRSLVRDETGKPLHTIGVVIDISQHKQVERTLRESGENLRMATEAARMFKWEFDFEKGICTLADNFVHVLGFSAGLLPQNDVETLQKLSPEEDRHVFANALAEAIRNRSDLHGLQGRVVNPEDGQTIWLEVNAKIVYDEEGRVQRMFGLAQNVTESKNAQEERKRVENALRKSEARFYALLSQANAGIAESTIDMGLTYVNPRFCEMLGYSEAELFGKTIWELTYRDELEEDKRLFERMLAQGESYQFEKRFIRKDGSLLWASVSVTIIRDKTGKPTSAVSVAVDISERRRSEQALAEYARQQEALYQLSDQLHHTNSLESVYDAALNAILSGLQCDRASILLFDDTNIMQFVAWRGLSDRYRSVTTGHSPWTREEKNPYPICVGDISTSELSDVLKATIQAEGIRSLAFIPLLSNGKLIGKFMVYFNTLHNCSDVEIELGLMIARQLAFGIDRIKAENALRASEAKLQMELADLKQLQIISSQLIREDNIDALYEQILQSATALMRSDMASMQMLHPEKNKLQLLAWKGFHPDAAAFWEWVDTDSNSSCALALDKGERVIVTDVETSDFLAGSQDLEFYRLSGIKAMQSTPLISRAGHLVGMISTHWRNAHQPLERELHLFDMLARQAADLIERKHNEEALRASEERYRRIVDTANEGIWYIDLHAETVYSNEPMARLLGCSVEEVLRHKVPEFCFPEDIPVVQERIAANYQGSYEHFDFRFRRRDGREVLVLASTSPVFDSTGKITGALGMFVDITERKRAEARLRASETLYRTIARSIPSGGVYVVDQDFRYLVAEGSVTEFFGLTREMLEGHTVSEIFPDERGAKMEERLRRTFAGETLSFETEHEGRVYWTQQAPLPDTTGQAIIVTIDITERKRAEEALRIENERFMRFIDSNIVGILIGDANGRVILANDYYLHLLGVSRQDLIEAKVDWKKFTPPEWLPADEKAVQELREHGVCEPYEKEYLRSDGTRVPVYVADAMLPGPRQEIAAFVIDITERKQAEEALKQSEERFVRFMQHLPGLAWIKDVQGRYVFANATAEKAFNAPREKLYGRSDAEIFPPEVALQFKQNDEQALVSEKGMQTVEMLQQEDGVLHYSLVTKFPIPGPDGKTALIGGTAFDITERLQAEEALRESESRFRALVSQATAGILRQDSEGRLIFVNQAFCNMLGYTEQELLGKTTWEFTHPDDIAENERLYRRMMMEGIPFKLEKRLVRADSSILWVDVSVDPVMDAAGRPQSAVAVEVDITARKQAEEALQQLNLQLESRVQKRTATIQAINQSLRDEIAERKRIEEALRQSEEAARASEEKLRTLFDLLPVGISFLDPEGQILQINSAVMDIVKLTKEQLFSQSYKSRRYIRADGTPMQLSEFASARALAENRTIHNVETGIIRENGEVVWTSVSAAPVDVADVGVVVVTVDITEAKRAERALKESHQRLRLLSQRLVEVQEEERRALARELHDRVGQTLAALNINLIIINSQLLPEAAQLMGARLNDSMKLVAETIALVRDVMTDLRPAVLDDYGLEAALEAQLSKFTSRYNIKAVFEKPDQPIPRLGPSVEMTFMRIAQEALMNIARHAQARQVNLSLRQERDEICLSIHDDGIGIESWQDANRPGSHGLTIMRERADAFGGKLRVSSVPGQGTTVEVSIPFQSNNQKRVSE